MTGSFNKIFIRLTTKVGDFLYRTIFQRIGATWQTIFFKPFLDVTFTIFEKVAIHFPLLTDLYKVTYIDLVNAEIEMIKITKNENILVIGCGSLPITAVLLAQNTPAHIVAIDNDHVAVNHAVSYIKQQNLTDRIEIHLDSLEMMPIKSFHSIFISYGIQQPLEMLTYVAQHMAKFTKIIFRTTIDASEHIDKNNVQVPNNLYVVAHRRTFCLGAVDSYLLKSYKN